MCYCPQSPAVTTNSSDFDVLNFITWKYSIFLVLLWSKLAQNGQKMAMFIRKNVFHKNNVLLLQISISDRQKSKWFWCIFLRLHEIMQSIHNSSSPEIQISLTMVKNYYFRRKKNFFLHKNVLLPKVSSCNQKNRRK